MKNNYLQLQQLDEKLLQFLKIKHIIIPSIGWIRTIRKSIGMSMLQLGKKLSISKQGVLDIEKREMEGSITIKSLKEIGNALDMKLVYGFIPNEGSLEKMIDKKAIELAKSIVLRTSNTMKLENQGNSDSRIKKAIRERADEIKNSKLKILWD